MPLPEQKLVPDSRLMKAPYNFVRLPEAVLSVNRDELPGHDVFDSHCHTGSIDLTITTETLLYTRCAYPPELDGHKVHRSPSLQDFFHHGNPSRPFLPGSSLRGMLLTLVEVISFSRVNRIHDEHLIYRAVGDTTSLGDMYRLKMFGTITSLIPYPSPDLKGGYLKYNNGLSYIQPATVYNGESFVHTESYPDFAPQKFNDQYTAADVMDVWLLPPPRRTVKPARGHRPAMSLAKIPITNISNDSSSAEKPDWVKGKLVKSGHMHNKHSHCVIYEEDPNPNARIPIPQALWEKYQADRDMNRGIRCRPLIENNDPLFYLVDRSGNLVFFGPTMMFRMPYSASTVKFIPECLRDPGQLDIAEAIFGSTERKGRVRFPDAAFARAVGGGDSPFCVDNNGRIIPKILSSPKPTSFQNYLVQNVPQVQKNDLNHYGDPYGKNGGTVIRGHKFYWNKFGNIEDVQESCGEQNGRVQMDANGLSHYRNTDRGEWRNADMPDAKPQHTVIKPVRPGCVFKGKIHFENLSDIELGALLSALDLEGEHSRHRLGMGKPYGMGRIHIQYTLNLEDRKARYNSMNASGRAENINEVDAIASTCRLNFQNCIKEHHVTQCGGTAVDDFWEIPRLKDLALLMHQSGPNDIRDVSYVPLGNEWKQRNVLPSPRQVMGLPHEVQQPVLTQPSHEEKYENCIALKNKSNSGKWKFQVIGTNNVGTLENDSEISRKIKVGNKYKLKVISDKDPQNIIFRYNTNK
jgi:CRISPR-associated protein (TIGR03986 family)